MTEDGPRDVADALQRMNPTHIWCRARGHAWDPYRATLYGRRGSKGWEERLRCARCRTERWQILDRYGCVVSSRMLYPDGYLIKGLGRLTGEDRGQVRIASRVEGNRG